MPRVLIVDDSAFMRNIIRAIVSEGGYTVVSEACDGVEAIRQFDVYEPDVVTMDITMPKMNGIDATRVILAMYPSAKIVLVSSIGQETFINEAMHVGASGFVTKPIPPEKLLNELRNSLKNNPLREGQFNLLKL